MARDVSVTRARLMAAAHNEFAESGIAGARVDRIAAKAGVNKQRIYGLFGDKEALFEAVITEAMDSHTAALGMPGQDAMDYFARIHDFHVEHPELLRLLMWEALYYPPGQPVSGEDERTHHYKDKVAALARSTGTDDPQAAIALLALLALTMLPSMLPQLTRMVTTPFIADRDEFRTRLLAAADRILDAGHDQS